MFGERQRAKEMGSLLQLNPHGKRQIRAALPCAHKVLPSKYGLDGRQKFPVRL